MATTGELRAIIQELQLVDIGDAASYLGEEAIVVEESSVSVQTLSSHDELGSHDTSGCIYTLFCYS
jgi:hypothetical protein